VLSISVALTDRTAQVWFGFWAPPVLQGFGWQVWIPDCMTACTFPVWWMAYLAEYEFGLIRPNFTVIF
jgi:hypothetical protein